MQNKTSKSEIGATLKLGDGVQHVVQAVGFAGGARTRADYLMHIREASAHFVNITLSVRVVGCVFRSIRSRIGIEVRSAIRIHSINRELNFFYRFLTRFFAAFHYRGIFPQ